MSAIPCSVILAPYLLAGEMEWWEADVLADELYGKVIPDKPSEMDDWIRAALKKHREESTK